MLINKTGRVTIDQLTCLFY